MALWHSILRDRTLDLGTRLGLCGAGAACWHFVEFSEILGPSVRETFSEENVKTELIKSPQIMREEYLHLIRRC